MTFEEINEKLKGLELQSVFVPEFGCEIYFRPKRGSDDAAAKRMVKDSDPLSWLNIALVNVKALNADGSKMFKPDQFGVMTEWPVGDAFNALADKMRKATPIAEVKES